MFNVVNHGCGYLLRLSVMLALAGIGTAISPQAHAQQILRVCPASSSCTWGTTHTDLRDALEAAQLGDEIWVAAGTYIPTGCPGVHPLECSFELKADVELYGNFCGTELTDDISLRNPLNDQCITILSGEFDEESDDGRVLHVVRAEGTGLHYIDGFTITKGWARGWVEVDESEGVQSGGTEDSAGGGLLSRSNDIGIVLCRFTENIAGGAVCWEDSLSTFQGDGGAVWLSGSALQSNAWIHNCRFDENEARFGNKDATGITQGPRGGALYISVDQLFTEVMNSVFHDNLVVTWPLGACGAEGNTYAGNHAHGGAIALEAACGAVGGNDAVTLSLWNSVIYGNRVQTSGFSSPGNPWGARGGGVFVGARRNVLVRNTILRMNEVVSSAGAQFEQFYVWNSLPGCMFDGILDVAYSNVQASVQEGVWPGTGNITADPQFVDEAARNFRLTSSSPCIDTGTEVQPLPKDIFDIAKTGLTQHPVPDLDLRQRVIGCYVDMGAFEYPTPESSPGPADLTGDCCVNLADLLVLLSMWGPCPAAACPADLNNDGTVDLSDLLILLAAWQGDCASGFAAPIETIGDCFERIGLSNIEALTACLEAMMSQE